MERLTYVDENGTVLFSPKGSKADEGFTITQLIEGGHLKLLNEIAEKLANYEQQLQRLERLREQGKLLQLPCAVGDTVYIADGSSLTVREIHIQDNYVKYFVARFNPNGLDVRFTFDRIGKTVFLTREEAEEAL